MVLAMLVATRLAITIATPTAVSPDLAALVAAEADALWREAGVEIQWSIGDRAGWKPDAPMLYVLFSDRCGGSSDNAMPLASITFVDGEPLRRIIVCRDQVDLAASAIPGFVNLPERGRTALTGSVMGRAVAHEIGHYLFGREHSPAGLMRARHSFAEFCAADASAFAVGDLRRLARPLPPR